MEHTEEWKRARLGEKERNGVGKGQERKSARVNMRWKETESEK